jgi:signal transduction histidine kinase
MLISVFHYAMPHSLHWTHDILRRLYYIPIIFSGFYLGKNYTIIVASIITILYIPHAYTELFNMDPASSINKTLEIVLYFVIGYITSTLSDKVKKQKNNYQETAEKLAIKLQEVESLEEQLIQSGKLEALGQMSAGFAHEIKNPLSSIQATNELIEDECEGNDEVKELIDIQKKELSRLKELLKQFLNFAKPSN